MPCFTGIKKLRRAIWCKIFVVQEGYIPYLRTWSWKSPEFRVKQLQEEDEVHSDIQRLFPGQTREGCDLPEVAKKDETRQPLEILN